MILQAQSVASRILPSFHHSSQKPQFPKSNFLSPKPTPLRKSFLSCSTSVASGPLVQTHVELSQTKPYPAEISRTIMELSSSGTLSTMTHDGWPLGIGVRFTVDDEGTPILCLNVSNRQFSIDKRSSLHVQVSVRKCSLFFFLFFWVFKFCQKCGWVRFVLFFCCISSVGLWEFWCFCQG